MTIGVSEKRKIQPDGVGTHLWGRPISVSLNFCKFQYCQSYIMVPLPPPPPKKKGTNNYNTVFVWVRAHAPQYSYCTFRKKQNRKLVKIWVNGEKAPPFNYDWPVKGRNIQIKRERAWAHLFIGVIELEDRQLKASPLCGALCWDLWHSLILGLV